MMLFDGPHMLMVCTMNSLVHCENFKANTVVARTTSYLDSLVKEATENYSRDTGFARSLLLYLATNMFKQGRITKNPYKEMQLTCWSAKWEQCGWC
jgi:hypothetical protein